MNSEVVIRVGCANCDQVGGVRARFVETPCTDFPEHGLHTTLLMPKAEEVLMMLWASQHVGPCGIVGYEVLDQ